MIELFLPGFKIKIIKKSLTVSANDGVPLIGEGL
jgi:hypothetical protein